MLIPVSIGELFSRERLAFTETQYVGIKTGWGAHKSIP